MSLDLQYMHDKDVNIFSLAWSISFMHTIYNLGVLLLGYKIQTSSC